MGNMSSVRRSHTGIQRELGHFFLFVHMLVFVCKGSSIKLPLLSNKNSFKSSYVQKRVDFFNKKKKKKRTH